MTWTPPAHVAPWPFTPTALVAGLALAVVVYLHSLATWRKRSRGWPLPPGPRPLPFVGNMLDMPKEKPWRGFRDLCTKYGDVCRLKMFNQTLLVLGTPQVIFEFLDKRSANASDRLHTPSVTLTGHDWSFAFMSYGAKWRHHRRVFWQHFQPGMLAKYEPAQCAIAHAFLVKLLKDPANFEKHIYYTFAAAILKIVYGIHVTDENDATLAAVQKGVEGTRQILVSGGFLVDHFPVLRHLPAFFPFHRRFAEWRGAIGRLRDEPFARYKEAVERNETPPCVISEITGGCDGEGAGLADAEELAKCVGAISFEAGSDTTFSTLQTLFLAMSLHPEVQRKAQAELDAVVGPDRLPDFRDRDSLVYVNAVIKELMRWIVVTPLGLSHSTIEDDEFEGYFIPAGTVLMANIWACLHDSEEYEDPEVFRPERFIRDGKLDPDVRDPFAYAFGFGRRICPGRYFGDAALFINIASVLHVFDISAPLDEAGNKIIIKPEMSGAFLSYPGDCRCTIEPRASRAELVLNAESSAS